MSKYHINRRTFLQQSGCAALGSTALFSTLLNLKAIGAASIFDSDVLGSEDYKALVCIFLRGGSDGFNMLVPTENTEFNIYKNTRSNVALDKNKLLTINTTNTPGRSFAMHPSMSNLRTLFNSGKLAWISNIGTLVNPINKQQYYANSAPVPLGLFSHSDQILQWQTALPQGRPSVGWGGKIADLMRDINDNKTLSINFSLNGNNIFQTGNRTSQFALDYQRGSIGLDIAPDGIGELQKISIKNMFEKTYLDPFKDSYKETIKLGIDGHELIQSSLQKLSPFKAVFPETTNNFQFLGKRLELVAKMIASRKQLGMKRQIFFIDFDGFDTHDNLLENQSKLLKEIDESVQAFYSVIKDELNLDNNVTLFSISEFGRTLTSNGNGTDHAWGNNIFALGGSVNGQKIYGQYPQLTLGAANALEIGGGSLIPTTSADSYMAELALWFGVPETDLHIVLPNIRNFYASGSEKPIGFMKT